MSDITNNTRYASASVTEVIEEALARHDQLLHHVAQLAVAARWAEVQSGKRAGDVPLFSEQESEAVKQVANSSCRVPVVLIKYGEDVTLSIKGKRRWRTSELTLSLPKPDKEDYMSALARTTPYRQCTEPAYELAREVLWRRVRDDRYGGISYWQRTTWALDLNHDAIALLIDAMAKEIAAEFPLHYLSRREQTVSRPKRTAEQKANHAEYYYSRHRPARFLEWAVRKAAWEVHKASEKQEYWRGKAANAGRELPAPLKMSEILANLAEEYRRKGD